ncbi:hypothetical protein ElyMa_003385900 [Elysia marginata]|uniref:Uncharacterized protein n=1 Tax=Elysia marginata TaxID=1093978 RepID=A0AAV4JRU0_9GAST|nr:hypothetical protein ElyMa_003385900 [Elysia marginata]
MRKCTKARKLFEAFYDATAAGIHGYHREVIGTNGAAVIRERLSDGLTLWMRARRLVELLLMIERNGGICSLTPPDMAFDENDDDSPMLRSKVTSWK